MNRLSVTLLCTTLIFATSVMAQESDASILKSKLKSWQPAEVTLNGDQITVVTTSANITSEIYSAIISSGVCPLIWTKNVPANYLKNIKQINVTDKFKNTGYSFESPLSVCKEMGNLMEKSATAVMLGNTHTFNGK
ncbi:MAG TPA: hypothetical protein DEA84_11135 [Erwinia persicina]|nr:hypothetical protein [Erwinia persicina]